MRTAYHVSPPPEKVLPAQLTRRCKNSGVVLEKVCEYLYYNQKHAESKDVSDMDIPPELCLELLIAADYLDGMFVSFNMLEKSVFLGVLRGRKDNFELS